MVAYYLGEKMAPATAEAGEKTAVATGDNQQSPLVEPLIAQPVDITALNLDGGQLQAIQDLRKGFLEKIGGPNQNPNDPAYQARWRAAQAEADNLMQGMLGDQAYQDYQLLASANTPSTPSGSP